MEQPYRPPTPEEAVGQYGDLVYRLAYAKTGSRSDADDIYQEVFLRYLRKKPQLESEEHAKAWFLRVTINCMKSFWGSSFRRRSVPLDESLPTEDHPSDGTMESYLRRLPEQYRSVIHLFYFEGLSVAEIAADLNAPEGTVRSQLSRGRALLREALKEEIEL